MRYTDIVFPEINKIDELDFAVMARRLYSSGICFVYSLPSFKPADLIVSELSKKGFDPSDAKQGRLNVYAGIICSPKDVKKAKNKADLVIVDDAENIRETVEKQKPDILFGMEMQKKRDYMHQRNSGLNQVVCDVANAGDVAFGFSFCHILESRVRHVLLGRMMQNLKLCKKYSSKVVFASFAQKPGQMRSGRDLASFLSVVGVNGSMVKASLAEAENIAVRNRKIREKTLMGPVEIIGGL